MTFNEILKQTVWEDVATALVLEYPDLGKGLKGYRKAFDALQKKEPVKTEFTICIEQCAEDENPNELFKYVFAVRPQDNINWGLCLIPWNECLGMQVSENTLRQFTPPQIVACVVWELTYFGFDEKTIKAQVQKWDEVD